MDKKYYSPLELIKIATQHAYCAEHLLLDNAEITLSGRGVVDTLSPFTSLMYLAFELTLKAYLLHDYKTNNQHKNLLELLALSPELGLSNQDIHLLKKLSRQYAFRKGIDYELWDDRQQLQVFCAEIIELYERLQELMPLELQKDYHQ
ncbi:MULTISPECIES: hypothetical protein [Legionella]|uniref:HEPN domain-containing protein n=1 Tax=Legionella maceachernii TaxID=466 RepID=A0A0W0WGZ2_9GAMM|nr:hypothetical protein [Legionella maceachernii]KTD31601.1 hypothetical protein Lmac_0185 [Legionella maceachernii]SKA10896.1 hypothetical protein SAMN02745128_02121 [Legionella maceachernii]SUO99551.1 Uncharacterised protein [Legionella maceachernii]